MPPPAGRASRARYDAVVDAAAAWLAASASPGAVDALDAAVRALRPDALVSLAEALRGHGRRSGFPWPWSQIDAPGARARLGARPPAGLAGLLTLHGNGYVRQVALEALDATHDPLALRFLVLRLDDVVPSLRERARAAVEPRLVARDAAEVIALLPLARRFASRVRAGASATLRAIEAFAVDPARGRPALLEATRSAEAGLRRAAVALAARRAALGNGVAPLLVEALTGGDARLARWAAIEITSSRVDGDVRRALLPLLEAHRDPAIRRRAVLARAREPCAAEHLRWALVDPRAAVRAAARRKLRGGAPADACRALLRSTTATRRDILGALGGLAETGGADDAALALPWATSDAPALQAEAIRCVGALDGEAHRALLEAGRASSHRRVRREAERALARLRP